MIPQADNILITEVEDEEQVTETYKLDTEKMTIGGRVDGIEAMQQYIYKTLNTERYSYIIYSWDYGTEIKDLIGEPDTYVIPEIERRITEALMEDDRVLSVEDFEFEEKLGAVSVTFTVHTIYGDIEEERTVEY